MFRNNHTPPRGGDQSGLGDRPPALIQRLIILHDGLMPSSSSSSSSGGRGRRRRHSRGRRDRPRGDPSATLGEDATLEEHGEFVLYYHDHSLPTPSSSPSPPPSRRRPSSSSGVGEDAAVDDVVFHRHATEEAVRFAGLCRALRSIPRALGPRGLLRDNDVGDDASSSSSVSGGGGEGEGDGGIEEAEVVHLGESTLIYVPLELGGDVFAVAQVPRRARSRHPGEGGPSSRQQTRASGTTTTTASGSSFAGGADPASIRVAVSRMHAEFALLNGGVHRSLLRTGRLERTGDWTIEVVDDDDNDDDKDDDDEKGNGDGSGPADTPVVAAGTVPTTRGTAPSRRTTGEGGGGDGLKIKGDCRWEMPRRATIDDMGMGDFSLWYQPRGSRSGGGGSSLPNGGSRPSRRKTMTSSRVGRYDSHGDCDGDGDDHNGDYRYGGMKELFALRRERRALAKNEQRAERRWSSASDPDELFNEVAKNIGLVDCDRRIEALLRVLPIAALREKLAGHYDDRLRRMQGMCEAIGGGVGRCAVEAVPPPITRRGGGGPGSSEPVGARRPPSAPSAFVCLAAAEFVRSTMRERVPKLMDPRDGRLSGMCFFHRDRLVLSEFVPGGDEDGQGAMLLPLEIPCMIVEYFRSSWERSDADDARRDVARGGIAQNGNDTPLSRWRLAGAKKIDNAAQQGSSPLVENGKHASNGFESENYGFVAHPYPPTDKDGPMNSLFVRSMKKHVWLQRVYLPGFSVDIDDEVETLVAMFESEELTFLLFFDMPSFSVLLAQTADELRPKTDVRSNSKGDRKPKNGNSKPISGATQAFVDVLSILAEEMTGFCNMYSPSYKTDSVSDDIASVGDIDNIFQGEPGMEIISINRDENSFVLLSQNNVSVAPPPPKQKFGLFGNSTKSKDSTDSELSTSPSKYSNMLDCRHKLAASLPLDVTLALDDIFNEIGCFTGRNDTLTYSLAGGVDANRVNIDSGASKSIELCTFLPRGWVYARAYGGIELYIVLDTSKFVTINDVQKAVTRIRERVFNDNIR